MASELDLGWLDPQLKSMRRIEHGFGTGLCRALATRWGVDVVLVRVAFVVLTVFGGVGLVAYGWGTALTPGRRGTRPIDLYLPPFNSWGRLGQQLFVLATSILSLALMNPFTPEAWPLGVLLLGAFFLWRTRYARPSESWPLHQQLSDDDLVTQWRARMGEAAASRPSAPNLSFDPPEKPFPARRLRQPPPPASWLAPLLIAGISLAGAITVFVLQLNLLTALGAGLALAGPLSLSYSLFVRRRRLPGWFVFPLAMTLVPAGWLASIAPSSSTPPTAGLITERVVGTTRTIDLRSVDLSSIDTIRVEAVAANVTVILPGPAEFSLVSNKASILVWEDSSEPETVTLPYTFTVDSVMSLVEIQGQHS